MAPTPESVSSGPTRSRIILFVLLIGVIFLLLSLAAYLVARVRRLSRKANPERYAQPPKTSPSVDPVPSETSTDPFQTPQGDTPSEQHPPTWAVQYQVYLESQSSARTEPFSNSCSSRQNIPQTPMDAYPRGLGILMGEESATGGPGRLTMKYTP
ncbi:hypothetical protein BDW22DRAFT_1355313 [Trametopsis cervina]|nr:hypothetical protein BDW22DRAFT_1355313 [Trametopsis cervina]